MLMPGTLNHNEWLNARYLIAYASLPASDRIELTRTAWRMYRRYSTGIYQQQVFLVELDIGGVLGVG